MAVFQVAEDAPRGPMLSYPSPPGDVANHETQGRGRQRAHGPMTPKAKTFSSSGSCNQTPATAFVLPLSKIQNIDARKLLKGRPQQVPTRKAWLDRD